MWQGAIYTTCAQIQGLESAGSSLHPKVVTGIRNEAEK